MFNTVDEEETNDMAKVLKELSEIKDMVKGVQAKQRDIEKNVQRLTRAMDKKEFDLAKSAHAVNAFNKFLYLVQY